VYLEANMLGNWVWTGGFVPMSVEFTLSNCFV